MRQLKNLLARYTHIQAPDAVVKEAFIQAVEETTDISLESKQVKIHKKSVRIDAPATIKSEIRLNQREILARTCDKAGNENALTSLL